MLPPRRTRLAPAFAIVASLLALLLSACNGVLQNDDDATVAGDGSAGPGPVVERAPEAGDPRAVALGLGAVPGELTTEGYIQSFATAAQYADSVLVRKTPPWAEFMPGGSISAATEETTRLERALLNQYGHLDLVFAIDPTDGRVQRSRAIDLPAGIDPETAFANEELRQAFVAYTTYVVKNYQPDYLVLGVEVNMIYARNPELYEEFLGMYAEAYVAAKEANPGTRVLPSFQLEDLMGRFGDVHPPHWEVLDHFEGMMDALAISSYPYVAFESAGSIPEDYYAVLRDHWQGEIIIAETGYTSRPVDGYANIGSSADQDAYLRRLLSEAEANQFSLVVWFAPLDPPTASGAVTSVFSHIGLRERNGANKLAWGAWEEWARRPLTEPEAEAGDAETPEETATGEE